MKREQNIQKTCMTRTVTSDGERWQDKSRKLRRGRVAEELRCIKYILRGAIEPLSLSICITHCDVTTTRTSRTPAP